MTGAEEETRRVASGRMEFLLMKRGKNAHLEKNLKLTKGDSPWAEEQMNPSQAFKTEQWVGHTRFAKMGRISDKARRSLEGEG